MQYRRDQARINKGRSLLSGVWREARQLLALAVVGVMISMGMLLKVEAAPGDLDRTFSGDGKLTTNFSGGEDFATAIAIQSDGKIVVAGIMNCCGPTDDFAVARYNSDGTLDKTFSGDGKQTTDFSGGRDGAYGIAIQSDGKIVVAGFTYNGTDDDFGLARYNSDGALDTTFSTDGKQTTDFFGEKDFATAIAIQRNGKIVVIGISNTSTDRDFALARYNSNGTLDRTFSGDGKQTTDFVIGEDEDEAYAVAIQSNSKIVVAGFTSSGPGSGPIIDFALARYNSNGALDTTFSTDGKQTTDFSASNDGAFAIAIQSDGRIVAAGRTHSSASGYNFALARYMGNGSLDTTFSSDGKQATGFFTGSNDEADAIAIQSDGKIVVAGSTEHGGNYDFGLARYTSIGKLSVTFSRDGRQTTGFFSGSNDFVTAVAIQSDGKIVAVGGTYRSGIPGDFALARYLGD